MPSGEYFDVIVIGVGSMGASACYYLAANGASVLGIEQFDVPHENGSHAGQSRIVRKAYFEHPDYVPLLQRAYQNWEHLEAVTKEQVFFKTGLLYAGPKDHAILRGVKGASEAYGIPLDAASQSGQSSSFSAMKLPAGYDCIFEPDAGFVIPEKAIRLYAGKAKESGATILTNTKVLAWKENDNAFEVQTTAGHFRAGKLVFCSGAWTSALLPTLSVPLKVTKQVFAWMKTAVPDAVALGKFPCWMIAQDNLPGCFYGFPVLPKECFDGPEGFKLAWHYPGTICDPDKVDRSVTKEEEDVLKTFLHDFFPGIYVSTHTVKTCLYTNSPDEHFIIDYLPGYEGSVAVAAGFSGHGFKFVSVVGEVLSDMVLQGGSTLPVGFLGLHRFGQKL